MTAREVARSARWGNLRGRHPAGRKRIHLVVDDLDAEIDRIRRAGLSLRSELVTGPGGCQILLADPAGNLVELFQPARPVIAPASPG